jgi:hypothetical protein
MGALLARIVQSVINGIGGLGSRFIGLLPTSPFISLESFIGENPAMEAVLWIIPVAEALALLQLWLAAILIYYAVKVPLRWAKIVKS